MAKETIKTKTEKYIWAIDYIIMLTNIKNNK